MGYVGVLLVAILVSFIIVRIGAFALHLTGMEPGVATFQALSAFSGTGFTTRESERVVAHRSRRRIISVLIILGNAGLVTIVATLVASFTQVSGYSWFFIRLAMIIVGIFLLYQLIIRSTLAGSLLERLRRPLMKRIMVEAPPFEEILHIGGRWSVNLAMIRADSKHVGRSLSEVSAAMDIEVLGIDKVSGFISRPGGDEKIEIGDRLLVYGTAESLTSLFMDSPNRG
jgi:MFS family permease